jgi:hypothetical protein
MWLGFRWAGPVVAFLWLTTMTHEVSVLLLILDRIPHDTQITRQGAAERRVGVPNNVPCRPRDTVRISCGITDIR